jgi:single-stranded DNA-binding protein
MEGNIVIWNANMFYVIYSTLVYLEGDASMRSYEDADGKRHSALNIVQRMAHNPSSRQPQPELPIVIDQKKSNN